MAYWSRSSGTISRRLIRKPVLPVRSCCSYWSLGFAASRKAARQLVRHRHVTVDGRMVDIPSYSIKPGEVIKVRDKSKNLDMIHAALKEVGRGDEIPWLRLNKAALEGELLEVPTRENIPLTVNEQLIVELYSK